MTPWHSGLSSHSLERKAAAIEEAVGNMVIATTEHVRAALVRRVPDSTTSTSSSSTASCTPGSKSRLCQYDTSNAANTTLPIALGVAIPLIVAFILCFYLHRRYQRRQRMEDDNDKHKSLDFGLGDVPLEKHEKPAKKFMGKKLPEMQQPSIDDTLNMARNRGVSFDAPNPYVLPPVLHDTQGSLHSLSRSQDDQGPYHSIHLMRSPDMSSSRPSTYRSKASSRKDSSSDNTASSASSIIKANLISHAQKPATTIIEVHSPPSSPLPSSSPESSPISIPEPAHVIERKPVQVQLTAETLAAPAPAPSPRLIREGTDQSGAFVPPPRSQSRPLPPAVVVPQQAERPAPPMKSPVSNRMPPAARSPAISPRQSPAQHSWRSNNRTPRGSGSQSMYEDDATYVDVLGIVQKESRVLPTIPEPTDTTGLGLQNVQYDNPEQRANRVHSVYDQYTDDGYNGYGNEYLDGAAMFDPETGRFIVGGQPWASPVTRRAMTPPPRAPPRFRGSPSVGGRRSSSANRNGYPSPRARAHSSASGHVGYDSRGRQLVRPLPGPLSNLPTPHLLKTDSEVMSAIDFAPPLSYKDRQAGKAPSPLLGAQPFAPRVRAFSPLASSFDDLHVMPSPHALRKSTSFTALDFAPPPRFRRGDGGSSDSGSVRSGRSNLSAAHLASIRAGAYRVSRIPREMVGTTDDFAVALKPEWGMRP